MIFGHKTKIPNAQVPSILNSIRVQRSDYGSVIPIVFGQNRVGGKLIWYGDFTPIAHTSTQQVGGKGLGGKKSTQSTTSYTYQAAVAILLCEGAIQGLYNVWDTKGKLAQQTVTENYVVPSGGGTYTVAQSANYYDDYGVGRTDSYSVNATDYGDIPRNYSGNYKTRIARVVGTPATGQYSRPGTGQYQFAAGDAGKTMSITYQYNVPDSTGSGAPATSLSLTLFLGTLSQTPWGYLTTNHPTQADGYSNMSYLASQTMDLGSQGSLPNYTYEVIGLNPFGAGITDANPADIITTLLTDPRVGAGISSSYLGSMTQYSNYCIANGLFISPVLDSQRAARDWIQEYLDATNSTGYYSEGLIKFAPYGDTTAVGNGVTYTPATSPVFDFNDDNYLDKKTPVTVQRTPIQDAYNCVTVNWTNRSNSYNPEPLEEKDDGAISNYGLRPDNPIQYDFITSPAVAAFAANTKLKRNIYIRKTYKFSLGWQFGWIEPMDLVTLTDSKLGLSKVPCRVTKVDEDFDTGRLDFEAEEFPFGTATATLYAKQAPTSFTPQTDADPSSVNTPIIYEPTARATQQQGYELWFAVSGQNPANWGGCNVWASRDGSSYQQIGVVNGPARTGVLTGTFASGTDPDTTNTCPVDLTQSLGSLSSGSAADCDNFVTLCLVGNEIISYQTATLTSANKYTLGTRIRRGVYGSPIGSHGAGTVFVRLDQAILKLQYDPNWIGQTIHFKFQSFNNQQQKVQPLSVCTDYPILISGVKGAFDNATGSYTGNLDTIADGGTRFSNRPTSPRANDLPYNGDFEVWRDGALFGDGWNNDMESAGAGATFSRAAGFFGNFGQAITANAGGNGGGLASQPFGVRPNTKYEISCRYQTSVLIANGIYFRIFWYKDDANFARAAGSESAVKVNDDVLANAASSTTAWQFASGVVVSPSDAKFARIAIYNYTPNVTSTVTFDSVVCRPADQAKLDSGIDANGNLLLKNKIQAAGSTSNPTTQSTTFVTIPEMSVTLTTAGNKVLIIFSGVFTATGTSTGATQIFLAIFADGVQVSPTYDWDVHPNEINYNKTFSIVYLDAPAAGSHTYTARWKFNGSVSASDMSVGTNRTMEVVELG